MERTQKSGLARRTKNNWALKINSMLTEKSLHLSAPLPLNLRVTEEFFVKCKIHNYEFKTSCHRLKNIKFGCVYCAGARPKITKAEFEIVLKKLGYTSSLPEKINYNTQVELSCGKHPVYKTWVRNILEGHRCPYCKGVKLTEVSVDKFLKTYGYTLLNNYEDVDSILKLKCSSNHIWHTTLRSLKHNGGWCTECKGPGKSSIEYKLICLIKKWDKNSEIYHNDRKLLGNKKELDIVIENKKIAIEPGGLYWHNELFKSNNYHYEKYLKAKKLGYTLLTIWDYEWYESKIALLGRLKSILGFNKYKIGAREVELKHVEKNDEETKDFLNKYHLQGAANFDTAFQLRYKNKLLAVMTFGKHHRQSSEELVLNRYCVKKDYTISGGAQKLFKTATEHFKCDIVSYSDNRWSEGKIYETLGFKLTANLRPDYFYTNKSGNLIRSKQSLKKTKEERKLKKTEHELRLEQGFLRVYDCGKKKWLFQYTKLTI